MAVLIEGISVIVRMEEIPRCYLLGGWESFKNAVPNNTLCADSELARVGFMIPADVGDFVKKLEQAGFIYMQDGKATDLVVVDQLRGPTTACDWIEFGHIEVEGNRVAVCRLKGSTQKVFMHPDWWEYKGSLTENSKFMSTEEIEKTMRFLRREGGLDVYLDLVTNKEIYIGRTSSQKSTSRIVRKVTVMKYHLIWYTPCALVIFLLTTVPNFLCVWDYTVTFFNRFSWLVLVSPSAIVFIIMAFNSVFIPLFLLWGFPKMFAKTQKRKFWVPFAFLSGVILVSIISEIIMWGSFPLPADKEGNIHVRMIPFIPWPEEGRSNIFF